MPTPTRTPHRLTARATDPGTATEAPQTPASTSEATPLPPAATDTSPEASAASFDAEWAQAKVDDILHDIGTVDERLADGIEVPGALRLLGDSFARLADAGVPPGVDPATYLARLATLEEFAHRAAGDYDANPIQGQAAYAVVREQTGVLFQTLNSALGTNYQLP